MAWSDAGERLETLPTAGTGSNFVVSNRPAVSAPATAACRCRSQSLTASGMIYDHVSVNRLVDYSTVPDSGLNIAKVSYSASILHSAVGRIHSFSGTLRVNVTHSLTWGVHMQARTLPLFPPHPVIERTR